MTQARKRMTLDPKQWVAFSKVSAQAWMGEYVFELCVPPLTLV